MRAGDQNFSLLGHGVIMDKLDRGGCAREHVTRKTAPKAPSIERVYLSRLEHTR